MSSQKGNVSKSGPPAHQNRTAFHHNKNSKLTKKVRPPMEASLMLTPPQIAALPNEVRSYGVLRLVAD